MVRGSGWSLLGLSIESIHYRVDNRFQFKTNGDATSTLVMLLYRVELIGALMNNLTEEHSGFIHIIALYCIYLPTVYLMLLIGHYSKNGCMVFGKIVPLIHGIGFSMAFLSLVHVVYTFIVATDSLLFIYHMFVSSGLSWMECNYQNEGTKQCFGYAEIRRCQKEPQEVPCIDSNVGAIEQLSAYQFRFNVLTEMKKEGHTYDHYVNLEKVAASAVTGVALAAITDLRFGSGKCSRLLLSIHISVQLIVVIIVTFFCTPKDSQSNIGMESGILDVFRLDFDSLFDEEEWIRAFLFLVKSLSCGTVSITLIGSYMPLKSKADLLALEIALVLLFLYILGEILISTVISALAINIRVDKNQLKLAYQDNLFVGIPQIFGMGYISPKLVSMVFYAYLFFTCIFRASLILTAIYETIADIKPIIRIYKFYIRTFSCIIIFLISLPMFIEGMLDYCLDFLRFLEYNYIILILTIILCSVNYMYRAQIICDDHHFIYGSQPVTYYRVMLNVTPLIFIIILIWFYSNIFGDNEYATHFKTLHFLLIFSITLVPNLLGILYKVLFYLKQQNMIHLLKCEDDWGDPRPNVRKERIIYHPRKETKYFRRLDNCKHKCLRYNAILPLIVKEEKQLHTVSYTFAKGHAYSFKEVGLRRTSDI